MHYDAIEVRTDVLRSGAAELADTAHHLGYGLHGTPGLTVAAPGWAATAGLDALQAAVDSALTAAGVRLVQLASALHEAADGYDAADERAARRLIGAR